MEANHEKINNDTKGNFVTPSEESELKINPKDPRLLDTIARKYKVRIVGEEKNIKTLVCCLVSKNLPKQYRLSVIISNQSSTGKSHLLNIVLEAFRNADNDEVIDYTDFTEAHFKRSQHNVNGKIIKLEQLERRNENGQLSFQRLKHLLSEGRLKFGLVDKNKKGQNKATDFEIVGVPIIVTTATEFSIDSETANRFLMMQLDESDNQTDKIIDHTLSKYSQLESNEQWQENLEDLSKFFKNLRKMAQHVDGIVIPFAHKLKDIIPKNLEIRRDLPKILNLTCIIAFIHGLNRPHLRDENGRNFFNDQWGKTEKEYTYQIIALPEDFIEAVEIAGATLNQTINKSSQKLMEVHRLLKKKYDEKIGEELGITVLELAPLVGLSENRTREYLKELVEKGFAYKDESEKIYKYCPTEKKFSQLNPSNIIFSKEELQDWIKDQIRGKEDRFSVVMPCDDENERNPPNLDTESEQTTNDFLSRGIVDSSWDKT